MRARLACALVSCAVFVACGPTNKKKPGMTDGGPGVDTTPQPHTLIGITATPTNPIVELDLNTPGTQQFMVTAVYADQVNEDVTASATWTVANPAVGTMDNATATLSIPAFTTSNAIVSLLTAQYQGFSTMAQVTVVAYRKTGTMQDFFFILPYQDPAGAQTKPLDFSTAVPSLDVFFLMDTTGSMGGEIANLQGALTGTVIPGIQSAVANSEFGVGALEDFPVATYGATGPDNTPDQPLKVRQVITNNTSLVASAVAGLTTASGSPIGSGNDIPEGGLEAIYQAATGNGLSAPTPTNVPVDHTGVGGVEFRHGTMPVIVAISDADSHGLNEPGNCNGTAEAYSAASGVAAVAHSRADTKNALAGICARFVGIAPQSATPNAACIAESYFQDLATSTGARVPPAAWDFTGTRPAGCAANQCCTGFGGAGRATDANGLCPLVFRANLDGTGVSASVVTGIQMLTRFATFDVTSATMGLTTDTSGNPLPAGHTTADFLQAIMPATFQLPPPPPNLPNPTYDATTFHNVTPGTTVGFNVQALNTFVPQTDQPQIFRATIQVLAGACTPLDQRDVLILVPPMPISIQ